MDSFEWNKIFGAVLGSVLVIVAIYIFVGGVMAPPKATQPGMEVAVTEQTTTPGQTAAEAPPDWGTVLPAADVAAGEKVAARCLQCHDFTKGGPDKIGPNLYGIVGAHHAHKADYAYSPAMKALADKTWDYEALNRFLTNPKAGVPGTKMAFAGLSRTADRVNIIAYLRTLSDSPAPIPPPNPATPAAAPAAPTEGAPATPAAGGEHGGEPPAGEVQAPPPGTPAPAAPASGTTAATPTPATPGTTPAPAPAGSSGH